MRWGWRGGQESCHVGSGRLWLEVCILFDLNPDITNPSFSMNELAWPLRRDREPLGEVATASAGPDPLLFPSTIFHRTGSFRADPFSLWKGLPSKTLISPKTGSHGRKPPLVLLPWQLQPVVPLTSYALPVAWWPGPSLFWPGHKLSFLCRGFWPWLSSCCRLREPQPDPLVLSIVFWPIS